MSLEDEKSPSGQQFNSVSLQMDSASNGADDPDVMIKRTQKPFEPISVIDSEIGDGSFDRSTRPGSTMSRTSRTSTSSKTAMSTKILQPDSAVERYFSKKLDGINNAVELCQSSLIKPEVDGRLLGAWLLTEIDHWDSDREKIVLITDKTLLSVRFDFVTNKVVDSQRVSLNRIVLLQLGDLQYPEKSFMTPRQHGGVRIVFGDLGNVSFGQRWNPWCNDIPFCTFAHHPIIYNEKERETTTYNVDDFCDSLQQAITACRQSDTAAQGEFKVVEQPILIESYASVYSMIFNQSHLGYNRDRGGISF